MFIRPAINGHALFNRRRQTIYLEMPNPDIDAIVALHLQCASLQMHGVSTIAVLGIVMRAFPDFSYTYDDVMDGGPSLSNTSEPLQARISGGTFDVSEATQVILTVDHPSDSIRKFCLLMERDLRTRAKSWRLNGTVLAVFEGSRDAFDRDAEQGLIDPTLPDWEEFDGDVFGALAVSQRLQLFDRLAVHM